ncbi:MAG: nitrate reductase subunit beta, partial [Betaproteobacteria bacterium HGW-Betaproteobacteria-17]
LTSAQADEMYRTLAIANYEDRFVIPSGHREEALNTFEEKSSCGFTFGNGCSDGVSPKTTLFGNRKNSVPVDLSQLHAKKKTG